MNHTNFQIFSKVSLVVMIEIVDLARPLSTLKI